MKRVFVGLIVLFLFSCVSGIGWAAQEDGDSEVAVSVSASFDKYSYKPEGATEKYEVNLSNYSINLNYGYFITAWHELGFMFLTTASTRESGTGEDKSTSTMLSYNPGILYRLNIVASPTVVPYFGVSFGYVGGNSLDKSGDDKDTMNMSGYFFGGELGCKFFVSEKTSFFLAYMPLYQSAGLTFKSEYKDYDGNTVKSDSKADIAYLRNLILLGISAAF